MRLVRSGTITTVAGSGAEGFSGDGGPATAAELDQPKAVAVTADGSLLIGDAVNNRIRRVQGVLRAPLTAHLVARSLRARIGKPASIRYTLGAPARVRVRLLRKGRAAAAVAAAGKTGRNVVIVRKLLRPGRYRIELVATAGGETARASGLLTVTP